MKVSTLLIRTPEGIVFSQLLAGPVTRFLAWWIDVFCIVVLMIVIGLLLMLVNVISSNLASAIYIISFFLIRFGYSIACEWAWRGQTVGKRVLQLRVVDAEGMRLQFNQVVMRNLLRFVDALPVFYVVGGIACWLSQRCQRLGDFAANTVVIRNPRVTEPDLDQLLAGKYNSLRQYPHLAARLRQRVSPAEATVALQALVRRDEFEPGARVELFASIAAHFRGKVDFPPEAIDGITDEQYIRNVVDVLFRTRTDTRMEKVAA